MKQKVLICGAGIAGLTCAYWMHVHGWEVVLLERASELRRGEFVIDFAGTGWDVAARMGLDQAVRERRSPLYELRFCDGQGLCKAKLALEDFVDALGVRGKHASINRRDLVELLYAKVQDRVEIRYSTSICAIREDSEAAWVRLSGESLEERFDLVIGADGLHSQVRALSYGKERSFANYLGYQVSAFRVHGIQDTDPGVMTLLRLPSRQAGILNLGDQSALALFVYADPEGDFVPRSERKAVLSRTFGEMGGIVPSILDAIDEDTALYLDSVTQIEMPSWHTKRTVLVGDAAYCLTLVSGQGASMAMGGAYLLADALAQAGPLETGLEAYEHRLRPFVEDLQKKTRRLAGSFVPSGQLGLLLSQWGMQAMGVSWIRGLAASRMSIRSIFEAA